MMIVAAADFLAKPLGFNRGYANTGVVHLFDYEPSLWAGATALCGRSGDVGGTWSTDGANHMLETAQRLPGHQHGVCRRCVKRAS